MLARFINRIRAEGGRLLRDTRGATAMFVAIGIIPLIGSVGLAVDSSLGYLLQSRMAKSLDTAGLAAGRIALNANAADVARAYFDANFGPLGSITVTDFTFTLDPTRQYVTLTAKAAEPTVFMRIFGQPTVNVAARTVIRRETTGLELALVLDNTGSMTGAPFNAMQQAAHDLIDIIYGNSDTMDNLWVSIVPYVATVNIGPTRTSWLVPTDRVITNISNFPGAEPWKGCVMAQASPMDANDTPISVSKLQSFYYANTGSSHSADNYWGSPRNPKYSNAWTAGNAGYGPNLGCGPAILPLTASKTTVQAAVSGMAAWSRGGTAGNLGLSWGWRTISPRWRGAWGGATPNNLPLDYNTPLMEKVVVILTDGNNQFYDNDTAAGTSASDYTAYGRVEALGVTTLAQGRAILDSRMAGTCTAMKQNNIKIYTIIFNSGTPPDATAKALFQNCATTPAMYFYAPNNATLAQTFKAIGGDLANLRIVE